MIGTGGREHALARKLAQETGADVHAAPGNPGMAAIATLHDVDQMDGAAVAALAVEIGAELVVIGPEAPLVAGVADAVRAAGVPVFGPSREAAQLEGSKAYAKEVMAAAGVPTARSIVCTTPEEAAAALAELGAPYVVKDDALAAGKGVVVTRDRDEALAHAAGCERVVIEEFLDGPECSLFAICDGVGAYALQPAQDFKRIFDGGRGPNTGGMGSYSPLPWAPADLAQTVLETVVWPTVREMYGRTTGGFMGCLYVGLALTSKGPRVIEFNVRFGDPDIQPVLALMESDLGPLLLYAAKGMLGSLEPPVFRDGASVTVVLASAGYPESSSKGDAIDGVSEAEAAGADVIHAGTAIDDAGELVTAGGRVLAVRAVGTDVASARAQAYAAADHVSFAGMQRRSDIAAEPLGAVEGAAVL